LQFNFEETLDNPVGNMCLGTPFISADVSFASIAQPSSDIFEMAHLKELNLFRMNFINRQC
jgi:hypothetical protein